MHKKKTLLIVLGKGGHTEQMIRLIRYLGDQYNYEYMIARDDPLSKDKIELPGKIWEVTRHRYYYTPKWRSMLNTIVLSFESLTILLKTRADVVVSAGPGLAVPISYLAKLFGKKVIFIESWSRVWHPSRAGKLVYPIADLFFIQWPELKSKYPKAIYAGRLG